MPVPVTGAKVSEFAFLYTLFSMIIGTLIAARVLAQQLSTMSAAQRWRLLLWSWIVGWGVYGVYAWFASELGLLSRTLGEGGFVLVALLAMTITVIIAVATGFGKAKRA